MPSDHKKFDILCLVSQPREEFVYQEIVHVEFWVCVGDHGATSVVSVALITWLLPWCT